jgi:PHD/YefM family antitoxin component YafN of YafNO toxin-antitoxin module
MIDAAQDVRPFHDFRENSSEIIKQLKTTRRPITLKVDGETELVIQEASAYQRLLDLAAVSDEREGVRQGDEDLAAGRTRPAKEVFDELRKQYALSR